MIVQAAAALPSRSVPSVKRRNSAAASSSSVYAVGNSRARTGSSGSEVGPEKSIIASNGSWPSRGTAASLRSSSTSWEARERSRSASKPVKLAMTCWLRRCRVKPLTSDYSCFQGGPEAVLVHRLNVALHLLAAARADHGLAVLVHLAHQLLGLLLGVAEVLLEDVGDVGHQVDRVVPDDRDPRRREDRDLVRSEVRFDLDRAGGGHVVHGGTLPTMSRAWT